MGILNKEEMFDFLESYYQKYNQKWFIDSDPIQIPHQFTKKEDIEIAAFLSASIAWGKRDLIIKSAKEIIRRMDFSPVDFILNHQDKDLANFDSFKHRTFQPVDIQFFISSLKNMYQNHKGLENIFTSEYLKNDSIKEAISYFRKIFFEIDYPERTSKHISNVDKNSAAKRINMFLMWMVRNDNKGVHFGLWKDIHTKDLLLPLDTHTSRFGRELGLFQRKQNDWPAVEEITNNLRKFDPQDPVKYDFAIFGFSIFEKNA
jgi:uncharacterized protein (TIGR02757 family)